MSESVTEWDVYTQPFIAILLPFHSLTHSLTRCAQLSGMNDYFAYGYLGFVFGPQLDGTIYYLTGGPIRQVPTACFFTEKPLAYT